MRIQFQCPGCNAPLSISESEPGIAFNCPRCGYALRAPNQSADPISQPTRETPPVRTQAIAEDTTVSPDSMGEDQSVQDTYPDEPQPRPCVPPFLIAGGIVLLLVVTIGLIALAVSSEGDSSADKRPKSQSQGKSFSGSPESIQAANKSESRSTQSDSGLIVGAFGIIFFIILAVIGLGLYILPTFIAFYRKHPNAPAITAVNLLLGWFFIGWVAALVWSLTEVRSRHNYHYHYNDPPT